MSRRKPQSPWEAMIDNALPDIDPKTHDVVQSLMELAYRAGQRAATRQQEPTQ